MCCSSFNFHLLKTKIKMNPTLTTAMESGEWRVAGDCLSGGTTAEAAVGIIIFLWNGGEAGVKGLERNREVTIYIYTNNLIYKTVEVAPNFGYNRNKFSTEKPNRPNGIWILPPFCYFLDFIFYFYWTLEFSSVPYYILSITAITFILFTFKLYYFLSNQDQLIMKLWK